MKPILGLFLLLGAVCLLLAPSASAASSNLAITSGIPIRLYGDVRVDAGPSSFAAHAPALFQLQHAGLALQHVRVTDARGLGVDGLAAQGERRAEVTTQTLRAGTLTIEGLAYGRSETARLDSAQAVEPDAPPADLWKDAKAQFQALISPRSLSPALPPVLLGQVQSGPSPPGILEVPAATYEAEASDGGLAAAKVLELVTIDGTLRTPDGATLRAGSVARSLPGSVYAPGSPNGPWIGMGMHREQVIDYYVATPVDGRLTAQGAVGVFALDPRITLDGFLKLPWAEGSIVTPNETVRLSGEETVLGGDLRLHPASVRLEGAPRIILVGAGELTYVKVGLTLHSVPKIAPAAVATGAVAGLGLVALLVYFWPILKYGASLVLFPLYARVPKEQIFEHAARERLYERVKAEPGISTNKLAREVDFGWSTLTYHLRVLERNEAIVSVRDGRYKRFFDRQSGKYSNGKKFVLAVLKNDSTFDIARFILSKPGASQKEVAGTFALAPSSVHWHVERLTEAGLVKKLREAHHVKYFPGEAWDHVTQDDLLTLVPDSHGVPDEARVAEPEAGVTT